MRFNESSLVTLAANPKTTFDLEGVLKTKLQDSAIFFRRSEVSSYWCKLRGNLLFFFEERKAGLQPCELLVLENCRPIIKNRQREHDGYVFYLEFEGVLPQRFATNTSRERRDWVEHFQLASCSYLDGQIKLLQEQIAAKMGNRIEGGTPVCAQANDAFLLNAFTLTTPTSRGTAAQAATTKVEEDLSEIPICESALSCDTLPCNSNGRAPNPRVICSVLALGEDFLWQEHARTEVIESCVNPQFLCTMSFRQSDGFTADTLLRFSVYDVREKVSSIAVPMGFAEVALGVIQDATRFRIPLRSLNGESGYITIASWAPDAEKQTPPRSTTQVFEQPAKGHRRSQSLPPKLGVKLFVPFQGNLQRSFAHPTIHTYRLHSSLGGNISVHETLLESKLCFAVPQQLLSIWILREKELLQEISGMGELGDDWRHRQMDLLDKHLKLLKDYSQAKQNLQQLTKEEGHFFKRSSVKTDKSLEFIPVNLHLQRMWAQNDNLKRTGVLDIITVGAFTRHASKARTGGLIKLLQETKESPSKVETGNACKVQAANDAVQAIKQLRKEIVEIMSQLLCLAKCRNPKGMMPLCNEMISKTKTLLNIWEPSLVEEAFAFIEQHRIIEEPDNVLMPLSPFRKITQQLSALDLKSPELEDFATPVVAPPDLWPRTKTSTSSGRSLMRSNSLHVRPSPSATDINAIYALQRSLKRYNEQLRGTDTTGNDLDDAEATFQSLPLDLHASDLHFSDAHYDRAPPSTLQNSTMKLIDLDEVEVPNSNNELKSSSALRLGAVAHDNYSSEGDGEGEELTMRNCNMGLGQYVGGFLDTKVMSTSPSANYYRPTEEPEPLDLTQLNIEASVMCLVSKIKFLCGRCGSPAIRLRHPKAAIKRIGFTRAPAPDVVANQPALSEHNGNSMAVDPSCMLTELQQALECDAPHNGNGLNLNLTQQVEDSNQEQHLPPKKGNKFTDGLDLSLTTDWVSELRPSMRKLRHAMDGLLKTARLMHSVQRLQQDMTRNSINLEIMFRRDVCFSQALTALVSGLMAKLWGSEVTENFIKILLHLGPLAYFEGLLSLHGNEVDMWGDMCIAIEDLLAVNFTLVRSYLQSDSQAVPIPRVTGSRQSLNILVPVPEHVYAILPTQETPCFKVTPVFFNIGINERASLAEALGQTREQHRSNWDNYIRLKQYYSRYRKLNLVTPDTPSKQESHLPATPTLLSLLTFLEEQLRANVSKNVKVLHLAEDACRLMSGLRFTSCKSAKDRTGMAVTLEQCRVLVQEFHLPAKSVPFVLNTMRSEGTRMDNVYKNIHKHKYAFNLPQVLSLPAMYRPPVGSYGKAET